MRAALYFAISLAVVCFATVRWGNEVVTAVTAVSMVLLSPFALVFGALFYALLLLIEAIAPLIAPFIW
jgi:hypothetical protein